MMVFFDVPLQVGTFSCSTLLVTLIFSTFKPIKFTFIPHSSFCRKPITIGILFTRIKKIAKLIHFDFDLRNNIRDWRLLYLRMWNRLTPVIGMLLCEASFRFVMWSTYDKRVSSCDFNTLSKYFPSLPVLRCLPRRKLLFLCILFK